MEFSYYKFTGEKNSKDTLTFVPILLNSGYRWHFFKKFYFKPEMSMGINMVTTTHGEGDGFTIEENSEEHAVELMLRSSCYFGVMPTYDFNIEWGFSYGSVFESDGNITFFNISLGALYNF